MSNDDLWGYPSLDKWGDALLPPDDRPRGMLTQADRKVLRGVTEFKHQESFSRARTRIRERVVNGVLDFTVLAHCLSSDERARISESFDLVKTLEEGTDLYGHRTQHNSALKNVIAFVFHATRNQADFERTVENGIEQAVSSSRGGVRARYNVDIDITEVTPPEVSVESIMTKVDEGQFGNLTESEMLAFIQLFVRTEEVDTNSLFEEYQRRRDMLLLGEDSGTPLSSDEVFSEVLDQPISEDRDKDNEDDTTDDTAE